MPIITHAKLKRLEKDSLDLKETRSRDVWKNYYQVKDQNDALHQMLGVFGIIILILIGFLLYIIYFK